MAGAARAVRIRRDNDAPSGGETPARTGNPSAGAVSGPRVQNSAGSSRAFRMFLFFLVGLAVIYGLFMGFAVTSAAPGTNDAIEGVLTASVAVALVVGWWVTLGQAPTAAYIDGHHLVVRDRIGRSRRFPVDGLRVSLLRSNASGFLGPEPTEFVEVSVPRGPHHTYLVGSHFFDFAH